MQEKFSNFDWLGFILFTGIVCCLSLLAGLKLGVYSQRSLAQEAGVAEYRCDPQTGEISFVYKTALPLQQEGEVK